MPAGRRSRLVDLGRRFRVGRNNRALYVEGHEAALARVARQEVDVDLASARLRGKLADMRKVERRACMGRLADMKHDAALPGIVADEQKRRLRQFRAIMQGEDAVDVAFA